MFRVGEEVVCVSGMQDRLEKGATYMIVHVGDGNFSPGIYVAVAGVFRSDGELAMWHPTRFRKVERRNDSLSIEAFLTIKPNQFEGPTRTNQPAKRKEQA